jgi:molybdopterin synthase catalytic subunit
MVKIRYYAAFREFAGKQNEDLDINNIPLIELLNFLSKKYPTIGKFIEEGRYIILRNGYPISDDSLSKIKIGQNDVIDLMPPPSGGSSVVVKILRKEEPVDIVKELKRLKMMDPSQESGAIAVYIGFVKGLVENNRVKELRYEVHEELTLRTMKTIAFDAMNKYGGLKGVVIYHRVGNYKPGDDVLYVLLLGISRKDVLPALNEIVERIKHEVGIWKLELREDGSYWVLGDGERLPSKS